MERDPVSSLYFILSDGKPLGDWKYTLCACKILRPVVGATIVALGSVLSKKKAFLVGTVGLPL